jgi:hypothetical protein
MWATFAMPRHGQSPALPPQPRTGRFLPDPASLSIVTQPRSTPAASSAASCVARIWPAVPTQGQPRTAAVAMTARSQPTSRVQDMQCCRGRRPWHRFIALALTAFRPTFWGTTIAKFRSAVPEMHGEAGSSAHGRRPTAGRRKELWPHQNMEYFNCPNVHFETSSSCGPFDERFVVTLRPTPLLARADTHGLSPAPGPLRRQ